MEGCNYETIINSPIYCFSGYWSCKLAIFTYAKSKDDICDC